MKSYDDYKELIEKELCGSIPEIEGEASILRESMEYSLNAPGKRLRPVLLLASADLAGGDPVMALPYACAIEFIHTYSLIHDDLPAMDDDDLRRGIKTNHKVYGAGMATLAGDGLLNSAFEIMLGDILSTITDSVLTGRKVRAEYEIAKGAGVRGMIAGQACDIESDDKDSKADLIGFIEENKTAALIIAPVRAGLILGGADEEVIDKMTSYAEKLGTAFQIEDDILDVTGDETDIGKPVGSDIVNDKLTYVSRFGIDGARKKLHELTGDAVSDLDGIDNSGFFEDLVKAMEVRTK